MLLDGQISRKSRRSHSVCTQLLLICKVEHLPHSLLYLTLSPSHVLVTKSYFSGFRKTSTLSNLFQVIWGVLKTVMKLSESNQLTGPGGLQVGCERHTAWSGREIISQAFGLPGVLCLHPKSGPSASSYPLVVVPSQTPSEMAEEDQDV